ncbi:MAG TPA: tetratricopeptide repeat protein [bacterium]|nr:tetratricopeptide repeat protein [bacterium]
MLTYIFIIIIIICLFFLVRILAPKFKLLTHINLEELKVEKQAKVKAELLEKRLKRNFGNLIHVFKSSQWKKVLNFFYKSYQRISALEKKYIEERKTKKILTLNKFEQEEKIRQKINQAEEYLKDNNFSLAEKIFLEVITINPKNIVAYLGLAKIYIAQKDFNQAKEIYEFIIKIDKNNDRAFNGLGSISLETGDLEKAKNNYQKSLDLFQKNPEYYLDLATVEYKLSNPGKALTAIRHASEIEPNNPKYLDFLIEAAIINKNKILALDAFNKLKNTNPENQKLPEFKKKIQEM